jgi:hypothetical protein
MDIRQAIQTASADPRFQQALQVAQQELGDASPEQIDELIQLIEFALQSPKDYPEIRAAAIADEMVEPDDLPEQFDGTMLASVLVVLYKLREGGSQPQMAMARGGLSRVRTLARQGRMGDTMLAHINPEEAALLKARGGAGTINPNTGLPQYFSLKKLFKAVLPIALTFIAPGLGTAIGSAILGAGASAAASAALGGAILGGLSSGLTGGNVLQGALLGGLGGGLGGMVGGGVDKALGLGLGKFGQSVLGGALVGGVGGAATGQGFGRGALTGALGAGVGEFAGQLGGDIGGRLGSSISAGGQQFGQALTAGYDPKTAAGMGAVSGLATAATYRDPLTAPRRPSEAVVAEMRELPDAQGRPSGSFKLSSDFKPGELAVGPEGGTYMPGGTGAPTQPSFMERMFGQQPAAGTSTGLQEPPTGSSAGIGLNAKTLGTLALASSLAGSRPPDVQQAIQGLNPAQQEYFNRPSIQWDWQRMQNDANAQNMSLSQFMASYWPQITSGTYNVQVAAPSTVQAPTQAVSAPGGVGMPGGVEPPPGMYRGGYAMGGGPLGAVARLARGSGSGRDDTINARLSDGEYVMDAETVAMLGDGSNDEGARRLDAMRAQLRKHKGKTLARGKFSPNAKSPLAYLKGAA